MKTIFQLVHRNLYLYIYLCFVFAWRLRGYQTEDIQLPSLQLKEKNWNNCILFCRDQIQLRCHIRVGIHPVLSIAIVETESIQVTNQYRIDEFIHLSLQQQPLPPPQQRQLKFQQLLQLPLQYHLELIRQTGQCKMTKIVYVYTFVEFSFSINFYFHSIPLFVFRNNRYIWRTSRWSPCSATCDGGYRVRNVRCVSESTNQLVDDRYCFEDKPGNITNCAQQRCPKWRKGGWGQVNMKTFEISKWIEKLI